MPEFTTIIKQFGEQGEKTGWTYIDIPASITQRLMPGNKKSFRVKGKLDDYAIAAVALLPMGGGDFIMALNATIRKGIKKRKGAMVKVKLEVDEKKIQPPAAFLECLADEPEAQKFYETLLTSHKTYFTTWLNSVKTDEAKARRLAQAINALAKKQNFVQMVRSLKKDRTDLRG